MTGNDSLNTLDPGLAPTGGQVTLAEQVAECERGISDFRDGIRRYDLGAMQDAAEDFANKAAVLFPSLVARLREAESLLERYDPALGDTTISEFLKGRLSP